MDCHANQDAIGKKPSEICSGEFGNLPSEQDDYVLRTGMPIIDHLEMQWEMPGRPVWCLTTKIPLNDDGGRTAGIVGFSRDIGTTVAPLGGSRDICAGARTIRARSALGCLTQLASEDGQDAKSSICKNDEDDLWSHPYSVHFQKPTRQSVYASFCKQKKQSLKLHISAATLITAHFREHSKKRRGLALLSFAASGKRSRFESQMQRIAFTLL